MPVILDEPKRKRVKPEVIKALEEDAITITGMLKQLPSPPVEEEELFKLPKPTPIPIPEIETFYPAAEALQYGVDIPEGWQLKVTPTLDGFAPSLIDPSQWEHLPDDMFISPERTVLTLAQVEKLYEIPEEKRPEFPTLPMIFEPVEEVPLRTVEELEAQLAEPMPVPERIKLEEEISVLKAQEALGIVFPEREIAEVIEYYFPPVVDIEAVPPAERVRVEEQQRIATERMDEFISEIVVAGRTPETEALLRQLDPSLTDIDITDIFTVPADVFARARLKQIVYLRPVTDPEFDVLFATQGERGAVEDWVMKYVFPKKAKEDILVQRATDTLIKHVTGLAPPPNLFETAQFSFIAGWGTVMSTLGGTARWLGWEGIGESLSDIGADLQENRPPNTLGEFDLADLLNPEFYATKVAEAIPFALSLAPLAIGGFYAGASIAASVGLGTVWSWIVGGFTGAALSRPAESALEAGSQYDDAIARGKSPKEAREEANEVFRNNMVLGLADAWEIAIALAPTPKWVPALLIKRGLVRTAIISGKMIIVGLTEGGEEIYQDMVQRHARGEEWKLDPVSKEVFAIGFIMGAGMGLGGDVISNIVSEAKGKMSPEQRGDFDKAASGFQEEGFRADQAELKALDTVAQTPEGAEVVGEAIETVKEKPVEEIPPALEIAPVPVPPTAEAFQARLEEALVPPTEVVPVEPVVTPLAPIPENPDVVGREIAEETGLRYDGVQEGIGLQFTDVAQTGTTFYANTLEEAKTRLIEKRELFAKPLVEVRPTVTELQRVSIREEEITGEIEGLEDTIRASNLKRLLPIWRRIQRRKDQPADLTIKEYRDFTGKEAPPPTSLTKDKKHVIWSDALDSVVTEYGFETPEALMVELNKLGEMEVTLKELYAEREIIKDEMVGLRLEPTTEEKETTLATPGEPKLTLVQIDYTLEAFGRYIAKPSTRSAWELTQQLRAKTRTERAIELKARAQELIVEKGIGYEEAIDQAIKETMAGKLPVVTTDYLSDLTREMRDALFGKVYHTLKAEPYEMMSTTEALTNALLGKPIPRILGVKGMSAYTRLQRVFGEQPQVFEAIEKGATEGESLEDVVEGVFRVPGQPPTPLDPIMVDYLRVVGKEVKTAEDLAIIDVYHREHPPAPPLEPPITRALGQVPMWPTPMRDAVIQVLKEIGWSPVDIGNFIRANLASVDMSFWRQQAPLILNHKNDFVMANVEAWKALFSQKAAEASWERITRDPLYHLYSEIDIDFLRPLELAKGTSQWRGVEEFGYLTGERLIPRLTQKLPWVKLSARAFVTGTNAHNWRIFKDYYGAMLRLGEMYASGEKTLKPGEAFSITKEMTDMAKLLTDFTARGQLGKAAPLAPVFSAGIFAVRMSLGRILTPRHLVSSNPRIRVEAFKNLVTFIGGFGGLILLGNILGLWEVEKDPRSAEYMSIRIGNTRIDPWGGFRQFLVFFTRIITKTGLSSVTGAEYEVDPLRTMLTFVRGKASPLASIMADFWTGRNFIGEEVDVANPEQWLKRLAPFAIQDVFEAYMEDPTTALQVAIPAILGAGVQTYTGDWRENWDKLGTPKYSDNLIYGLTEPIYDMQDFWADTTNQFRGVDPATLTEAKGFPVYIPAIAEAREIRESLSILPNQPLYQMVDIEGGMAQLEIYMMQWREREKLVAAGDKAIWVRSELQPDGTYKEVTYKGEDALKAFDKDERMRNAYLGNITKRQYEILKDYTLVEDKEEYLDTVLGIKVNPRNEWLKGNPKENALLAVFGQAKILSIEAYDEFVRLVDAWDIPGNALPELTLPPKDSIQTHFDYLDAAQMYGGSSWEAKLILAKDPDYAEWAELQLSGSPVAALELKVKNRSLFDQYDSYNDKDSPNYIEDKDERELTRERFKADNPEWVDDTRRIEAIEHDAPDEVIEEWVDRGRTVDKFTAGSSEAMVWLLDHPETFKWALDQELLTDDGSDWNEPVLRINTEWRMWDDWYDQIEGVTVGEFEFTAAQVREEALNIFPEYAIARRRRDAYRLEVPEHLIDTWVEYYSLPLGKVRTDFLREHPEYYTTVWLGILENKPISGVAEAPAVAGESQRFVAEAIIKDYPEALNLLKPKDQTSMNEAISILEDALNGVFPDEAKRLELITTLRTAVDVYVEALGGGSDNLAADILARAHDFLEDLPAMSKDKELFMVTKQRAE